MAVAASEPVTIIEGIGPSTAEALQSVKVYFVFDLLRGSVQMIHDAVRSQASASEVRSWRAMASLLQVAEITPQWAEALVRGGVISIEMLFRKNLNDIETMMAEAQNQGIIQDVPTTAPVSSMLKDAAVLAHTGSITGTLHNDADEPIAGATVRIGSLEQQSDERGRFRLLRIPLAAGLPLHIAHPDYLTRTIESPPVARNIAVIDGRVFRLSERPDTSTGIEEAEARFSELEGDALPVPTGQPLRSVDMNPGSLRPRDVLKVHKLYQRAPDAGLVSYFKSYEAGEFIVHTVRVPLSELTQNVQLGDQFQVSDGSLRKVDLGPTKLHRYKMRLRLRKRLAGRPAPTEIDELNALIQECYAFLRENGYFNVG
ncbi:MAG: DUF4332 domain-containing protein [Acidobacteriota bacterium]